MEKIKAALNRLENVNATLSLRIPNEIHVDAMRQSLPEIIQDFRDAIMDECINDGEDL